MIEVSVLIFDYYHESYNMSLYLFWFLFAITSMAQQKVAMCHSKGQRTTVQLIMIGLLLIII